MNESDNPERPATGQPSGLASIRAAFSSWWSALGIAAASVSGFNLVRNLTHIDLSAIVEDVVQTYQGWVHVPLALVCDWLGWPRPSPWMIDGGVTWIFFGGIVLRSALVLRQRDSHGDDALTNLFLPLPIYCAVCVLFWPLIVFEFVRNPFFTVWRPKRINRERRWFPFTSDLRVVLALQGGAAMAAIGVWFVLNALLERYG